MKGKSTRSFQVVMHLKYPVWSWSPREKIKQMSGLFQQDSLHNHPASEVLWASHPGKGADWPIWAVCCPSSSFTGGDQWTWGDDGLSTPLWGLSSTCPSFTCVTLDWIPTHHTGEKNQLLKRPLFKEKSESVRNFLFSLESLFQQTFPFFYYSSLPFFFFSPKEYI